MDNWDKSEPINYGLVFSLSLSLFFLIKHIIIASFFVCKSVKTFGKLCRHNIKLIDSSFVLNIFTTFFFKYENGSILQFSESNKRI